MITNIIVFRKTIFVLNFSEMHVLYLILMFLLQHDIESVPRTQTFLSWDQVTEAQP